MRALRAMTPGRIDSTAEGPAGIDTRLVGMLGVLGAVWIVLELLTGGTFLSARNLYNLSVQVTVVAIMTTGMVLLIVARQIDLSVGSLLGFLSVAGAMTQTRLLNVDDAQTWWLTLAAMLSAGAAIGAVQGALVAYANIPSFVVTLGGLLFFRNAAYFINQGETIAPLNESFQRLGGGTGGAIGPTWSWVFCSVALCFVVWQAVSRRRLQKRFGLGSRALWLDVALTAAAAAAVVVFTLVMNGYSNPRTGAAMGIPVPVILLIGVVGAMSVLAQRSRFGSHLFAYGGNPEAAKLAGVNTQFLILRAFALMGLLCGLAAAIISARLNAGASATGTMVELSVIAAAVIGGTSLAGGVGRISGAVLGALFMQSLESGMILLGISSPLQKMVLAVVLILAVWADHRARKVVVT
jgi:D-xylose transport system permease protein